MQDAPNPAPYEESPNLPPPIQQQPKKSNKTLIIVLVVILALCCICLPIAGGLGYLWNNGDALMEEFGSIGHLVNFV